MQHPLDMTGQTILITGASSGLGAATAHYVSRLGANVVLVARRCGVLQNVADSLHVSFSGQTHWVMPCDLQQSETLPTWYEDVVAQCGICDGLVHAAAIQQIKAVRYLSSADVSAMFRVGVEAGWIMAQLWAKFLREQGRVGSLVFLSSVSAYAGQPGFSNYCASKGSVEAMTRLLARDFLDAQIRVNSVVAGQVLTGSADMLQQSLTEEQWQAFRNRHPLGFGLPEDVAGAVAFLLSPASRRITGTHLVVDGGYLAQ